MIDLLQIAKTEADGGDLQQIFDNIYEKSDTKSKKSSACYCQKSIIKTSCPAISSSPKISEYYPKYYFFSTKDNPKSKC